MKVGRSARALLVVFGAAGVGACSVVDIGDPLPPAPAREPSMPADPPPLPAPPSKDQRWDLANPRPVGVDLYGVWGPWLVGQAGTVLRFDGANTTTVFSGPVDDDYHHVWASSDDDVWIAGRRGKRGHVVLHGERGVFTADDAIGRAPVHALFGFAKDDVWMAVGDGRLMHFDGSRWIERCRTSDGSRVRAVWGAAPDDVWFAGDGASLHHFDGASCTARVVEGATPAARFFGVWGLDANDVWGAFDVEGKPSMAHFDGTKWAVEDAPILGGCFPSDSPLTDVPEARGRGMWGVKEGDRAVVMASRGGSCRITLEKHGTWTSPWRAEIEDGGDFTDMWGDRLESFFAVGKRGRIARLRGYNPGVTATQVFPGRRDQMTGVSIGVDGEIWARGNDATASGDQLYRWADLGWTPIVDVPRATFLTAVGVRSATDAWIATDLHLHHWNGSTWDRRVTLDPGVQIEQIVFGPDGDGWAIGNSIWRLAAGKWTRVPMPSSQHATAVWSLSAKDVWFSTSDWSKGGEVLHWDGKKILSVLAEPNGGGFWGIWAASPTDVFVSGNRSMHFDGTTWERVPVAPSFGVWGSDPRHVYFGAWVPGTEAAQILRWDAESSRAEVVARHWAGRTPLVFASAPGQGFAVGDEGLTFRLVVESKPAR